MPRNRSHRAVRASLLGSIARGLATREAQSNGVGYHVNSNPNEHDQARRAATELRARASKPNPAARPPASQSTALAALRKSRAGAKDPALIARLDAAIAALSACYAPPAPEKPVQRRGRRSGVRQRVGGRDESAARRRASAA